MRSASGTRGTANNEKVSSVSNAIDATSGRKVKAAIIAPQEPANCRRAEQNSEKNRQESVKKIEQRRTAEMPQADHPGITLRRIAIRCITEAGVYHAHLNAQHLRQHRYRNGDGERNFRSAARHDRKCGSQYGTGHDIWWVRGADDDVAEKNKLQRGANQPE
jgi:hypothetical protein